MSRSLLVENLSKVYRPSKAGGKTREVWALKDVSFEVEQGTILGVVGPNGAGKTTLLKVLSRITPPTSGRVEGRGRVVPLLALGSGMQRDMSGRENVFLNAAMYGISTAEVTKRFDEIVEFAGLADAIDQPVRQYSSGMYLRLAFSVAINMNPDILLADEVLAVGDMEFQERCLAKVQEASRQGITVLFVSHDMSAISRLCSRGIMLSSGELLKDGSTDEIVSMYQEAAWTRAKKRGAARNDHCELVSTRLVGADGLEAEAAKFSEDSHVVMRFKVREAGIRVRPTLDVFAKGTLVFRTVALEETVIDRPGNYSASVKIPAGLLAETVYAVNATLDLFTPDGTQRPLHDTNALNFRVYDVAEASRGTWKGKMPGVVAPLLDWTLVGDRAKVRTGV
ncbi:MAG TPA: ABC transporter ATP-binding protein [Vicinamibacterales bacterium]